MNPDTYLHELSVTKAGKLRAKKTTFDHRQDRAQRLLRVPVGLLLAAALDAAKYNSLSDQEQESQSFLLDKKTMRAYKFRVLQGSFGRAAVSRELNLVYKRCYFVDERPELNAPKLAVVTLFVDPDNGCTDYLCHGDSYCHVFQPIVEFNAKKIDRLRRNKRGFIDYDEESELLGNDAHINNLGIVNRELVVHDW